MLSAIWTRRLQYAFIAIVTFSVGFSLYQWNASRASTQKTAPNNGLVGYWSFNEGTGTLAGDASGNGNTSTLVNSPTWVSGKLGQAVSFNGSTQAASAPVNLSSTAIVSISFWLKWTAFANDDKLAFEYTNNFNSKNGFLVDPDNGNGLTTGMFSFGTSMSSPSGYWVDAFARPSAGVWHHYVLIMNRATPVNAAYVDGVLQSLTTEAHTVYSMGNFDNSTLYFMSRGTTSLFGAGSLDEVRIYNRALSGTEVTNLYNLGAAKLNTTPTANLTSGLVGYWTFDGKDTPWTSSSAGTATDRSGNGNTGTLTNMSQSTSIVPGKVGQALNFDGTDDYVIASGNPVSLQLTTAFTLSGWIKASTNTSDYRTIVSRENTATDRNYWLALDTGTGILSLRFSVAGVAKTFTSSVALADNSWHHVVATYNGSFVNIYSDGVSVMTPVAQSGSIDNPAATSLRIGTQLSTRYFIGTIDEVRVYNRALSATEVQSLYDLGASDKVNSSVSQNQGTGRLDSGLAGYWKLDDASGTTATDSSVNANNGTLTGGPTWGTGKIGGATDFTGTQYITIPNSTPLQVTRDMTVSFWLYLRGYGPGGWNPIINKFSTDISNEFNIRFQTSTTGQFYSGGSGAINTFLTWDPSADVGLNNWVHVVARRNITAGTMDMWFNGVKKRSTSASGLTDATTQPLQFGGGPNGGAGGVVFDGLLDEVRIYNRAISDEEIAQLYRLNRPSGTDTSLKGYWSFNGKDTNWTSTTAGTATDRSGNSNTGTLTNMSQSTSIIPGKIGQALKFDGVDDYVDLGSSASLRPTGSMSLCAWAPMYHSGNPATSIISNDGNSGAKGYSLYEYSINGTLDAFVFSIASNSTTAYAVASTSRTGSNGGVFHVCGVYDAPNQTTQIYVNGVVEGTKTSADGIPASQYNQSSQGNPKIGNRGQLNSYYFTGILDEVRLYTRALSASEVVALYNSGR